MCNRFISGRISRVSAARGVAGAVLGAALCLAQSATAQDGPEEYNTFEITPFAGYAFGGEFEDTLDGSERDLDEDTSLGLFLDVAADSWRHYELLLSRQSTMVDGAVPFDIDVDYLQVGGTVSYPDSRYVIPYFGLTVGVARLSPDGPGLDDETKLAFSVGGGVRVPITEHIGLRLDLRTFFTVLDTDGDLFCVSSSGLTCRVRARSNTLTQYAGALGITVGF